MKFYIEIATASLPFIASLNDGVEPKVEEQTTMFVYDTDPDIPNDIIGELEFEKLVDEAKTGTVMPVVFLS